MTGYGAMVGTGVVSHFFWTLVIKNRFDRLVQPYYEKYSIKWSSQAPLTPMIIYVYIPSKFIANI